MDNIKISYFGSSSKFVKGYEKAFSNYKLVCLDKKNLIEDKNEILENEKNIFNYLYENGGLFINGDFYFLDGIQNFFDNDFFISYSDYENLSSNLIWAKEKNNQTIKKILDLIGTGKYNNITEIMSEIVGSNLKQNYNYIYKFDENSFIYPYDYFFPVDYERIGKGFSDNIKAIFVNKSKLRLKDRNKIRTLRKIGPTACEYLFATLRNAKNKVGYKKYIFFQRLKNKFSIKEDSGINETLNTLDKYLKDKKNGKDIEYLIIHNPRWLGVTSATKELFINLLPIQEVYLNKNIDSIVNKILELDVKQIIFSAFDYGWDKIACKIREKSPNIKLKSFWHGSHSQVIEEINWETNLMVINLHKKGVIDVMGTCKESLVNFYKSQGYKTAFLKNTVRLQDDIKEKLKNVEKINDGKIRFGIYSAGTDWRKNTYNQVMAASLFENSELQVIPLRYDIKKMAYYNGLDVIGSDTHLKREDLLIEMAKRDAVLYVTFSECAPMLPIESLETGTICIMGNNHHYFKGSKLHDYLVVEREDDLDEIVRKIKNALENKEEILRLYKAWKVENDNESAKSVKEFLKM